MTPAELRVIRESLGLTGEWLARHLEVNPRTIRAWEQGKHPIPRGVGAAVRNLEDMTRAYVESLLGQFDKIPSPTFVTYRSDEDFTAHESHRIPQFSPQFPASWHRAVAARVAQQEPTMRIVYPLPHGGNT